MSKSRKVKNIKQRPSSAQADDYNKDLYYSPLVSKIIVSAALITFLVFTFLAYGNPVHVLKLLIKGDALAWVGLRTICYYLIGGFIVVLCIDWIFRKVAENKK